jgi:thymidylate synthase
LSSGENNLYTKASRPFSITDDDGRKRTFLSLRMAEARTGVPGSTLQRLLSGSNKHGSEILKGANRARMGWSFQYEEPDPGTSLRLSMLDGELGPIYSHQWRHWDIPAEEGGGYIDQIEALIEGLVKDPFSRRHIVSAWNVAKVPDMALPPCHTMFQFHVTPDSDGRPLKLNCQLYQRSGDLFLGVPFNIASYAVLTHMIAQQTGLEVGEFIHTFGDAHIYKNHIDQVNEQLSREARPYPELKITRKPESIFDYTLGDFEIIGYDPHPKIQGEVAV